MYSVTVNEEIKEMLEEHNRNIDKKIEEQDNKNKALRESIDKSHEEMMRNANNLFRKYDKTYEILMDYVGKKIDEQDKRNKEFGEKIKIILESKEIKKELKKEIAKKIKKNNYNNYKENINNTKNFQAKDIKVKDISDNLLIVLVSLVGITATILIGILFI